MSTIFSTLLALGQVTRGDAVVVSMSKKSGSEIVAGDFVKITESSTGSAPKQVEVEKVSAESDCIYGVATFGIEADIIPVVTSGHVLAYVDSKIFTSAGIGKYLSNSPNAHCCLLLIQKLNALKADGSKEENTYEIKL